MVSQARLQPAHLLFLAVGALILLSRVLSVADGRDPGIDQAALMSNFPLASLSGLFRPLPYFEQATSLGSAIELDLVSRVFGEEGLARFYVVRAIAATAALAAYFLLYRLLKPRFSPLEIALVLVILASPKEILLFTTNPKHYVFELLMTCLLMGGALAYLERPGPRETALLLGLVLVAAVLAVTAPLIVVAVGSGMLAATLAARPASDRVALWRALIRLGGIGALAIGICAVFYLGYTRPVSFYQTEAYAFDYETGLLNLRDPFSAENVAVLRRIFWVFYQMVEPAYTVEVLASLGLIEHRKTLSILVAVVAAIGYRDYWRRSPFLAGGLAGGLVVFGVLNLAGLLPFIATRHFMFFAPFAVPCFVLGARSAVLAVLKLARLSRLAPPFLGAVALGIGTLALIKSADLDSTEVSAHLDLIEANPAPVWLYYGAQPSVRALRPRLLDRTDPPVLGQIAHDSAVPAWALVARTSTSVQTVSEAFMARTRRELAGTEPLWMLFANHWPERQSPEGLGPFIAAAEADGRVCRKRPGVNSLLAYCARPGAPRPTLNEHHAGTHRAPAWQ